MVLAAVRHDLMPATDYVDMDEDCYIYAEIDRAVHGCGLPECDGYHRVVLIQVWRKGDELHEYIKDLGYRGQSSIKSLPFSVPGGGYDQASRKEWVPTPGGVMLDDVPYGPRKFWSEHTVGELVDIGNGNREMAWDPRDNTFINPIEGYFGKQAENARDQKVHTSGLKGAT